MSKLRLNLLRGELVVEESWLKLDNLVRCWGALSLILLLFSGYLYFDNSSTKKQYDLLSKKQQQLTSKLERFEEIISNQTVSPQKQKRVNTLRFMLQNKQIIHRQLTDETQVRVSGFANVMTELATYHSPNISLQHVAINDDNINVYGMAKNAEAVPLWLTGFENSQFVSGKQFSQFNLEIQEDGSTRFLISSKAGSQVNL